MLVIEGIFINEDKRKEKGDQKRNIHKYHNILLRDFESLSSAIMVVMFYQLIEERKKI